MRLSTAKFAVQADTAVARDVLVQPPLQPSFTGESPQREGIGRGATWQRACDQFALLVKELENADVGVFRFDLLLTAMLDFADARDWILERRIGGSLNECVLATYLSALPSAELGKILIEGFESDKPATMATGVAIRNRLNSTRQLVSLPALCYPRTTARWLDCGVVLGSGPGNSRRDEAVNMSAVLHFSPVFDEAHFDFWLSKDGADPAWPPIDGRDLAMFAPSVFVGGVTSNTSVNALRMLAAAFFRKSTATQILCVDLLQSPCDSLDQCFLPLDMDCALIDGPVLEKSPAFVIQPSGKGDIQQIRPCASTFLDELSDLAQSGRTRYIDIGRIGNKRVRQALSNLDPVVLAPGKLLAFEEHSAAFRELERSGISIAAAIPGSALMRHGRGPRNIVAPIRRGDPSLDHCQ